MGGQLYLEMAKKLGDDSVLEKPFELKEFAVMSKEAVKETEIP